MIDAEQKFKPGQKVYVRRVSKYDRLEGRGVISRYWRNGAWWVKLDPHGCETVFDEREIFSDE